MSRFIITRLLILYIGLALVVVGLIAIVGGMASPRWADRFTDDFMRNTR